jgi:hypothetical protein
MEVLKVFIGSSSEGRNVAERLGMRLEGQGSVEAKVWTQGVFDIGTHVLDGLIDQASTTDFAILVLSPDDGVESRDVHSQAPRDNVIFELGLFIGALGKDRTYMVQPDGVSLKLPSDLAGITQVRYNGARADKDLSSALGSAAISIHDQIKKMGARKENALPQQALQAPSSHVSDIEHELQILQGNLTAQGWLFRWNQAHTTLRVISPTGHRRSLKMSHSSAMRPELDRFVRELRGLGARIDSSLRSQRI